MAYEILEDNKTLVKIQKKDLQTFEGRAKHFYFIRSETGKLVPFELNDAQKMIMKIIYEELERTKREYGVAQARIDLLKARQIGGTTLSAVLCMDYMLTNDLFQAMVLAHDEPTTDIIFTEKYRMLFDNLPDFVEVYDGELCLGRTIFKPQTSSFNGRSIRFFDLTKSSVIVRTAGSGDNVGKGSTINFVHFSEFANYVSAKNAFTSVSQQISPLGFALCIMESTANGMQGAGAEFYNFWKRNIKAWEKYKKGETGTFDGYRPVFIPFYMMPKYRQPLVNGQLINIDDVDFYNEDFRKIYEEREEFVLNDVFKNNKKEGLEAINWYRWCIINNCANSILEAFRYYPILDIDAFTATDISFFEATKLLRIRDLYTETKEPEVEIGTLVDEETFQPEQYGEWKIWEHPDKKYMNRYIIGIDVCRTDGAKDWHSASVYDRLKETFVAEYRSQCDEDMFAKECLKAGMYWNYAFLVPEANLATVVNIIKPDGIIPYDGEVFARNWESPKSEPMYGFLTTSGSKSGLLNEYKAWLRGGKYDSLKDFESIDQHLNFIKGKSRQGMPTYGAASGWNDDIVISRALAIFGANRYEEEIAELNTDKTDFVRIIDKSYFRHKSFKQSNLGKF